MSTPDYAPDDFRCATFDPKMRALITPEIRAKMDADFERAKREAFSQGKIDAIVEDTRKHVALPTDACVIQSLATQLYLARKKLTECKCPHCQTIYDHLYPAKL
jgi:hypothetical protein